VVENFASGFTCVEDVAMVTFQSDQKIFRSESAVQWSGRVRKGDFATENWKKIDGRGWKAWIFILKFIICPNGQLETSHFLTGLFMEHLFLFRHQRSTCRPWIKRWDEMQQVIGLSLKLNSESKKGKRKKRKWPKERKKVAFDWTTIWLFSLGLISNAFHAFCGCSSLVVGLIAASIIDAQWKPDLKYTYG
jgi:hypothetical protein